MSVTFNLQEYQLTCYSYSDSIVLRLEPLKVQDKASVQYLYQAEYRDPNLPQGIRLLFNESTSDWYRYIDYYRSSCFDLDLTMILSDQHSDPNVQTQYTELPFLFKMKLIQGIKQPRFKLYGQKELFSKQLRLERMLMVKENVILELRREIQEKNARVQELEVKLRQVNEQKEELRQENERLLQQELPRKKIHCSQQQEQGCLSHQSNAFRFCPNNQDSNEDNNIPKPCSQHQHTQQIATQHYSTENQPSSSHAALSESHQNEPTNQILQRLPTQQGEKHSETFYNRPSRLEGEQNRGVDNQKGQMIKGTINMTTSVSMNFHNKKHIVEEERKNEEHVHNALQKAVKQADKQPHQIHLRHNQPASYPQVISAGGQLLSEQSIKMIREFCSKKCLMEVGYDERNQKKYGYCCIFCEKIFKEDEFLTKHLFSRHPQISNQTTLEYLTSTLSGFKRRREQKIAAFEANYALERRLASRAQILQGRT